MLSWNGNQYLQPDYLSPLPITLDPKKSPLALLAQICNRIGTDPPPYKSFLSQLAFKPSTSNLITRKIESRTSWKSGGGIASDNKRKSYSSNCNSASPANSATTMPAPENRKSTTPRDAILISSMGYKPPSGLPAQGLLCSPPGLQHTNPTFRPAFPSAPFSQHNAAMMAGYPAGTPTPYVSYTPSGGETLVPMCKYPYCTGREFSMHNQQMLAALNPSGCTQYDHQKYNLAMAPPPGPPPSSLPYTGCEFSMHNQQMLAALNLSGCTQYDHQKYNLAMAPPPGPPPSSLPYPQLDWIDPMIRNWIAGECIITYEELMQHLRMHTSGNEQVMMPGAAAAAATAPGAAPRLNEHSLFSTSAMHRYPNPPLSPLSATRYHPYAKPGGVPAAPAPAPPYNAFNPTTTASVGPYNAPFSYGQRHVAPIIQIAERER